MKIRKTKHSIALLLLCIGCSDSNTDKQTLVPSDNNLVLNPVALSEMSNFRVSSIDTFDSLGVLSNQLIATYDEDSSIMSQFIISEEGTRTERARYYFDKNGLVNKGDFFTPNNNFVQTQTYRRESDGRLINLENSTLSGKENISYVYESGIISKRIASFEGDDQVITATYEYDQFGNLIGLNESYELDDYQDTSTYLNDDLGKRVQTQIDLGNDGFIDTTETYVYDDMGNIIEIVFADENGELISRDVLSYQSVSKPKTSIINFTLIYFP